MEGREGTGMDSDLVARMPGLGNSEKPSTAS